MLHQLAVELKMNFENSPLEYDPSYDPERLDGSTEKTSEVDKTPSTGTPVAYFNIDNYTFDEDSNPFAWDADEQRSTAELARSISSALSQNFNIEDSIIRGVQSAHHDIPRDELIRRILTLGSDIYQGSKSPEIYAQEFSAETIQKIIDGFHVYKPKCDERPQYPVDIWMVFDKKAFENVEYLHPKHQVLANDKWRLKDLSNKGLRGILVIN